MNVFVKAVEWTAADPMRASLFFSFAGAGFLVLSGVAAILEHVRNKREQAYYEAWRNGS